MQKVLVMASKWLAYASSISLLCLSTAMAEEKTNSNDKTADIEKGKATANACIGCHGAQGIAMAPNFPNLAGQKRVYLETVLKAYQSGERNDPIMKGMVLSLKDSDIANLAAYYASLPSK